MTSCLYELFRNQYKRIFISQQIMFGISYFIQNPTLVDVSWEVNHMIIALGLSSKNFKSFKEMVKPTRLIGLGLTTIWAIRLGGFIFYNRIWNSHVDPRYKEISKRNKFNEAIFSFIQFQIQGVLSTISAIPLFYALKNSSRKLNSFNKLAIGFAFIGIIGEAIADYQLQTFKENRKDNSEILREGLFKNARHPNLFFELVFWTSIAAYGVNFNHLSSLFTFIGPVSLWAIMYYLTIPVTTLHMIKTKPNYEKVISETNVFCPF